MKKKYKKKKIKTGVIAASAFGITATVVLAVVLLTTGIKEDTSKTDDILVRKRSRSRVKARLWSRSLGRVNRLRKKRFRKRRRL